MSKPIWVKSTLIFCADLETCTPNTKYYQRTGATFCYAFKLVRVPIQWHASKKNEGENKWEPLSFTSWNQHPSVCDVEFGSIKAFIKWVETKLLPSPTTTIYIYFHNGQRFDYWFFLKPLIDLGWKLKLDDNFDNWEQGKNYFVLADSDGWVSLKIYFWMGTSWCCVALRDSIKIQNSSILSISKNLFGEKGCYTKEAKNNPWFKNFDLTKHLEFDPDFVQDKNEYGLIECSDGLTRYDPEDVKHWPQAIKDRVGSDVYIMVAMLYYYLLNNVINLPGDDRIPETTGSLAIITYVNMYLKQYPELKKAMALEPKNANNLLWNHIYSCEPNYRVLIRNQLLGNDDLPSIVRGGYCNTLDCVKNKLLKGEFISLDVNSEYPFVATKLLPYGEHQLLDYIPNQPGWYVAYFHVDKLMQLVKNAPAMLWAKWENHDAKNEHYKYEIKNAIISLTKNELENVFNNEKWFKTLNPKLLCCYFWQAKDYVKNYMLTNYEAKQQASQQHNVSLKTSAKLKLNSLTGKFIQNFSKPTRFYSKLTPLKEIIDFVQKNLGDKLDESTINEITNEYKESNKLIVNLLTPNSFSFAPVYCAITGGGRALIQSKILELAAHFPKIKVCYSDTDSIKIWTKNNNDYNEVMKYVQNWLDDNELGKLKEEFNHEVKFAKFLCPKKYLTADKDKLIIESKSALSGLSWKDAHKKLGADPININDINIGDKFTVLRPKKVVGGIVLLNHEFELKM